VKTGDHVNSTSSSKMKSLCALNLTCTVSSRGCSFQTHIRKCNITGLLSTLESKQTGNRIFKIQGKYTIRGKKCIQIVDMAQKIVLTVVSRGRESSVGITTRYDLDGPGIKLR